MENKDCIEILRKGETHWNEWRIKNPQIMPSLRNVDFSIALSPTYNVFEPPSFDNYDFSGANFSNAFLRDCSFCNCIFDGATIHFADLVHTYFESCSFRNIGMRVSKIGSATFLNCFFENSDLSYCSAQNTAFSGSTLINTKLDYVSFVANDFSNSKIIGCSVYGISTWDLQLDNSEQKDLIITSDAEPTITVDNIELAQFLHLIITNTKLRNAIDTITSKVVLILGNFSEKTKVVLNEIREYLRKYDYIPIIFDFKKPTSRNLTETVMTLANLSKFVVADLSSPRSIPHELSAIIPRLQSVNFYPIINGDESVYGMFEEYNVYPWVAPTAHYNANEIGKVLSEIIKKERKISNKKSST